ncbi:uncharacterized protein BYT42DRAFT_560992 [Radiomyces spectabilis]|uniref:uncharacterized protein n=1 Tax=Radiomyces spectabilis TaxID=64574 RepID=UPI00221FED78|nr:uncharacterized protein BYT42DRAFT_560992 [Radiomyces spectabilis]KAI8388719.1 hypothetical protein BYT42DRAFT_560992 [Radiomyces spectabilis]
MKLCVFTLLSWMQLIQAYCIYNKHTDGAVVQIRQKGNTAASITKRFRKNISAGEKECCSWQTLDCCASEQPFDPVVFEVVQCFPGWTSPQYEVTGVVGGSLVFHGNERDNWIDGYDNENNHFVPKLEFAKSRDFSGNGN